MNIPYTAGFGVSFRKEIKLDSLSLLNMMRVIFPLPLTELRIIPVNGCWLYRAVMNLNSIHQSSSVGDKCNNIEPPLVIFHHFLICCEMSFQRKKESKLLHLLYN